MTDQMTTIKDILHAALSDLTPAEMVTLTREPFEDLREV